ncbi:MAG: GTP-binding protein [Gammaproteobacteria bacterium]|nr:GTP-binding protein [Gammaproteobacteria bacterium]
MATITSKACIVGDFAVGKTSVVERFVNNQFSDKYLTTIGVKVDTKEIDLPERNLRHKLVLWDVAGADRFGATEYAYLRGAAGIVFVADGSRPLTIGVAQQLRKDIEGRYGPTRSVLLLNKKDLQDTWDVSPERIAKLATEFGRVFTTSAKTGDDVETALTHLANLIVENTLAGID